MNQNQAAHPIPAEEVMAFLDGELPAEQAAAVSAHLEGCAACREVARGFRQVSAQMAAWTVEPAPVRITYKVTTALKPKQRMRPWVWQATLATMGLFVIAAVSVPNLLRSRGPALDRGPKARYIRVQPLPQAAMAPEEGGGGGREDASRLLAREVDKPSGPMIARTASLVLIAKDFNNARPAVERIARQHQGYVAQLQAAAQQGTGRGLNATLRVPAAQMDAALAELKQLGRVERETLGGEEVTQQYVDLVARLTNARNTETRLQAVLRERTGKMQDVLDVEREIARVREEIEQMESQRASVEKRVAFGTVEVEIREEHKAQVDPGSPSTPIRLWNAGVTGYRNLTETVTGLAEFLLAVGPTAIFWTLLLWFPARFVWRRLRALAT